MPYIELRTDDSDLLVRIVKENVGTSCRMEIDARTELARLAVIPGCAVSEPDQRRN